MNQYEHMSAFSEKIREMGASVGRNVREDTISSYFKKLEEYEWRDVSRAIDDAINEEDRWSSIPRIRARASLFRMTRRREEERDEDDRGPLEKEMAARVATEFAGAYPFLATALWNPKEMPRQTGLIHFGHDQEASTAFNKRLPALLEQLGAARSRDQENRRG